jgi:hypothetical protein
MAMISTEFAEKLFIKVQENAVAELDSNDLEILRNLLCNEVMLKALGSGIAMCRLTQQEITQLNLSEPGQTVIYTRGQGAIDGIGNFIMSLINLIVEKEEEENDSA